MQGWSGNTAGVCQILNFFGRGMVFYMLETHTKVGGPSTWGEIISAEQKTHFLISGLIFPH